MLSLKDRIRLELTIALLNKSPQKVVIAIDPSQKSDFPTIFSLVSNEIAQSAGLKKMDKGFGFHLLSMEECRELGPIESERPCSKGYVATSGSKRKRNRWK